MFLIAAAVIFNVISYGAGSHLCTGLHANINITHSSSGPLLVYSLDLAYSANPVGFETAQISGTQLWAVNSSFTATALSLYSEVEGRTFTCPSDLGNCTLTYVDGAGYLQITVGVEGAQSKILLLVDVTYFKGTVFWNDGMVFTPDNACIIGEEWVSDLPGTVMYLEYCCNRFETLPDAPPVTNQCLQYTSNVEFYNSSMTLANLQLTYDHFVNTNMSINGINFTSNVGWLGYTQSINYGGFQSCQGTSQTPQSSCFVHLYDPSTQRDSEFAFFVDVLDAQSTQHWHSVAGSLEYRNGIVMRNGSDPFTPDKPCQYYQQGPIGIANKARDDGVSSRTSYCCSKWQNPVPTTTMTPTTTTRSTSGGCSTYNLTLLVANSTNFGGPLLSTLTATLSVHPNAFHVSPTYYSSFEGHGSYDISFLYNDFDTRNCRGSMNSLKQCTMKETDGTPYQFQFSTSFAQDGFAFFTLQAQNGTLTSPSLPNGCANMVSNYNYPHPVIYLNANLCCLV